MRLGVARRAQRRRRARRGHRPAGVGRPPGLGGRPRPLPPQRRPRRSPSWWPCASASRWRCSPPAGRPARPRSRPSPRPILVTSGRRPSKRGRGGSLLAALPAPPEGPEHRDGRAPAPAAQIACCIDVRSEALRRHLEAIGDYETLGVAGFFGLPMAWRPLDGHGADASCPLVVAPAIEVGEAPRSTASGRRRRPCPAGPHQRRLGRRAPGRQGRRLPLPLRRGGGLGDRPGGRRPHLRPRPWPAGPLARWGSTLDDDLAVDLPALTVDERADLAAGVLRAIGLTRRFAPLVVLCGHGSTTTANPYEAALRCGACGGRDGTDNARTLVALLSDTEVRAALADRGIEIPDGTTFVAARHDTTTDEVTLVGDVPDLPGVAQLAADLAAAGDAVAAERSGALPGAAAGSSPGRPPPGLGLGRAHPRVGPGREHGLRHRRPEPHPVAHARPAGLPPLLRPGRRHRRLDPRRGPRRAGPRHPVDQRRLPLQRHGTGGLRLRQQGAAQPGRRGRGAVRPGRRPPPRPARAVGRRRGPGARAPPPDVRDRRAARAGRPPPSTARPAPARWWPTAGWPSSPGTTTAAGCAGPPTDGNRPCSERRGRPDERQLGPPRHRRRRPAVGDDGRGRRAPRRRRGGAGLPRRRPGRALPPRHRRRRPDRRPHPRRLRAPLRGGHVRPRAGRRGAARRPRAPGRGVAPRPSGAWRWPPTSRPSASASPRPASPSPPTSSPRPPTTCGPRPARLGWPVVAKVARGGYDGRGVAVLRDDADLAAWDPGHPLPAVVEPALDIEAELAVQVARRPGGETVVYPVVRTVQVDGMCHSVVVPSGLPAGVEAEAVAIARSVAEAVDAVGLLAVELFLVDGRLARQRDRRPSPQHRPPHHRQLRDLTVREPRAGRARPPSRRPVAAGARGGDGQRGRPLAATRCTPGSTPAPAPPCTSTASRRGRAASSATSPRWPTTPRTAEARAHRVADALVGRAVPATDTMEVLV